MFLEINFNMYLLKELKNKILHINYKNILTNGTDDVIFTYEKEVIVWILIIK